MRLSVFNIPLLLAISFSFVNPCARQTTSEQPVSNQPVTQVVVAIPHVIETSSTVKARGIFSASDRLLVKSPLIGTIEKVFVEEGQSVNEGDVLTQLKSDSVVRDLTNARADLKEASAQLDLDHHRLENPDEGHDEAPVEKSAPTFLDEDRPNVPSAGASDKKESKPVVLQAGLEAKIKLEEAKIEKMEEQVATLEEALKNLTIKSAIAGEVQKRLVTVGSFVNVGDTLFEVATNQPMTLSAWVPADVASYIDKRSVSKVSVANQPDSEQEATVYFVGADVTPERGMAVKLHVPNKDGAIKEGQEGEVQIETLKNSKILSLPQTAVFYDQGNPYVYLFQANRAVKTPVKIGRTVGESEFEITERVHLDDKVIVSSVTPLRDGMFVSVAEEPVANTPEVPENPSPVAVPSAVVPTATTP